MLEKNGQSDQYHLKLGVGHPVPSEEEIEEFLNEMKRRANKVGLTVSDAIEDQETHGSDPNQMRLFE